MSHLDALWETASLIAGEEYPLNALEGFVLGSAILLHDSALCFEAYDKGIIGVRGTLIWKDTYAASEGNGKTIDQREKEADFNALRYLHAEQSSKLVEAKWSYPDKNEEIYLLENSTLRNHLGQVIGQISASHHWAIEEVSSVFSSQGNSPATFPREWRIDYIKIACLLRCADAAHIDNERAPDFLYALIKREGISFDHWQAQNRLANVDIDQSDNNIHSLIFTSTKAFTEVEAKSWWIAYDAACLVDQEIRSANALLELVRTKTILPLKAKRVKGVESPELMTQFIKVVGWSPCSAKIHVGNIENLVKTLGGQHLYGLTNDKDLFQVVVREMIQNARDAIKARMIFEPDLIGNITRVVCV